MDVGDDVMRLKSTQPSLWDQNKRSQDPRIALVDSGFHVGTLVSPFFPMYSPSSFPQFSHPMTLHGTQSFFINLSSIILNYNITMNLASLLLFAVLSSSTQGFSSPVYQNPRTQNGGSGTGTTGSVLFARIDMDRRSALTSAASLVAGAAATLVVSLSPEQAFAQEPKTVVVAGATGQTGRRVLERLAAQPGLTVIGGVRNVDKATKSLSESSTVIRGAMVQQVNSIDTSKLNLKHLDVVQDSVQDLQNTLQGADSLVIAVGFVPGNPLKMNEEAHKVDNLGTIKLIDAAKAAGLKKVVLVSSILTDGRSWGQEQSPGFVITNAFGKVLDEKIVAENYLRASGLDYTIVRPGGLKAQPRKSSSFVSSFQCRSSPHFFMGI